MLKKLFNRKRSDTPVIDRNIIPQHVAIIMDGNGRWAKRRGMPRSMGHRAGADVLKEIVMYAFDLLVLLEGFQKTYKKSFKMQNY